MDERARLNARLVELLRLGVQARIVTVQRDQSRWRRPLLTGGIECRVFAGDGDRFVRLFRQTWSAVPAATRRRLRRHWWGMCPYRTPSIELTDTWSQHALGIQAQVSLLGQQIRFHAPSVDRASDDDVRFVIAHELAHVLQWAEGRGTRSYRQLERDADARALTWLGLSRRPRRSRALSAYLIEEAVTAARAERSAHA